MKTSALPFAIIALLLGFAPAVSANYTWSCGATTTANTKYGGDLQFGYSGATLTWAQVFAEPDLAYVAEVKLEDPAHPGTSRKGDLLHWDYYATEPAKIYVLVWAGNDFPNPSFDLRIWLKTNNTTVGVMARALAVKCVYDPIGSLAGTVLTPAIAPVTGHSQADPNWKYTLPAYKTNSPWHIGDGYIMEVTIPGLHVFWLFWPAAGCW